MDRIAEQTKVEMPAPAGGNECIRESVDFYGVSRTYPDA